MEQLLDKKLHKLSDDEMQEINAGIHISNYDLTVILGGANISLVGLTATKIMVSLDAIALSLAAIPGLRWITGGTWALYGGAFAVQAVQALAEGKGLDIYITFQWGLALSPAAD